MTTGYALFEVRSPNIKEPAKVRLEVGKELALQQEFNIDLADQGFEAKGQVLVNPKLIEVVPPSVTGRQDLTDQLTALLADAKQLITHLSPKIGDVTPEAKFGPSPWALGLACDAIQARIDAVMEALQ